VRHVSSLPGAIFGAETAEIGALFEVLSHGPFQSLIAGRSRLISRRGWAFRPPIRARNIFRRFFIRPTNGLAPRDFETTLYKDARTMTSLDLATLT
jgi:hypothetical protein